MHVHRQPSGMAAPGATQCRCFACCGIDGDIGIASALLAQMRPDKSSEQLIVDSTSLKHNWKSREGNDTEIMILNLLRSRVSS